VACIPSLLALALLCYRQTGSLLSIPRGFVTNASALAKIYRKRHQPTPHYAWLWTLAQAINRTSGRSGSASEDDPAERGCSRSRTTLGSSPMTPGGSHMTASLGGRYDPWPVKRSTVVVRCSSLRACWSISVEHSARSSQEPQSDSYNFHISFLSTDFVLSAFGV